jgi:hypothetical protein
MQRGCACGVATPGSFTRYRDQVLALHLTGKDKAMKRVATGMMVLATLFCGASAMGQVVDAEGFYIQYEGTLTACDTNPFFGSPDQMPYVEGFEWGVDLDPMYDWVILETMVSDPVHVGPFDLWPQSAPLGTIPFGTHEMGFAMGIIYVFEDTNGDDPTMWGRGRVLLQTGVGMNHQEDDGHSGLSWWTEMHSGMPYKTMFIGSSGEVPAGIGTWPGMYGPGWIFRGEGRTNWYFLNFDWDQTGRFDRFVIEPISFNHGDMDLDEGVNMGDVRPFIDVLSGDDHDNTRMMLADFDDDGDVDYTDLLMFIEKLLG